MYLPYIISTKLLNILKIEKKNIHAGFISNEHTYFYIKGRSNKRTASTVTYFKRLPFIMTKDKLIIMSVTTINER